MQFNRRGVVVVVVVVTFISDKDGSFGSFVVGSGVAGYDMICVCAKARRDATPINTVTAFRRAVARAVAAAGISRARVVVVVVVVLVAPDPPILPKLRFCLEVATATVVRFFFGEDSVHSSRNCNQSWKLRFLSRGQKFSLFLLIDFD